MKNTILLLTFISILLNYNNINAQCTVAEKYVKEIKRFQDTATPTEYASNGNKIDGWIAFGRWNEYNCQCSNSEKLTDAQIEQLVKTMNAIKSRIDRDYSDCSLSGSLPRIYKVSDCKKRKANSNNSLSSTPAKSSTQIEMEKRLQNYNKAMSLKKQGENIAKAYAIQVKSYSQLNKANTPEALLKNFNDNMQAIADLEAQNKEDNLNQLSNTLNSSLNDLNNSNYEGAMFSTLSLLDQGEAKREAQREADATRGRLAYQTKQNMTAFYTKAVELNELAIKQYYEKAAYAYRKEEEAYLLEYVTNLECHQVFMENNFSYNNTSWTKNNCTVPTKKKYTINNLVAKDIQYISAAKRKYALYKKTGEQVFQKGAMRFAGLAATENSKAEYYYLMGHYAGINNPLVAYSSFLTAKSKNSNYFSGEKAAEFTLVKLSLESSFKKAIEENDQEVVSNIVGAGLHQTIKIDNSLPILYAIKIDQADVVFAFLNTDLVGKPQSVINTKVQSTLYMAALLDAPKTIDKFVDLGFSIDFSVDGKTPLDASEESLSLKSFKKIEVLLEGQSKYTIENSDVVKMNTMAGYADVNDSIKVQSVYNSFETPQSKDKALEVVLHAKKRASFFMIYEANKEYYIDWVKENRNLIFEQFCTDVLFRSNKNAYRYFSNDLINLPNGFYLSNNDLITFYRIWIEQNNRLQSMSDKKQIESGLRYDIVSNFSYIPNKPYGQLPKKKLEFVQKNPELYPLNILDFAIFKRHDPMLVNVLLKKHEIDLKKDKLQWHWPEILLIQDDITKKRREHLNIRKEQQTKWIQNGYEILDMLIFDFEYNQEAFSAVANIRFEERFAFQFINDQYWSNTGLKPETNEYLKQLLDKLIETGQANMNENLWWEWNTKRKFVKDLEDKKYWKAILDGKFDKRY